MGILEVVLLIAGIVIFIGSFLLPSGKESGINKEAAKEEIKGLMEEEMQTVRSQMQDKMVGRCAGEGGTFPGTSDQ